MDQLTDVKPKVIWKAVLKLTPAQSIHVPEGAELLHAREQFEEVCVWFRCDPNAVLTQRWIAIVGTGHEAPDADGRYIGTASLRGGHLMLHVFERVH